MIELKTPDEIDAMRAVGIVVADALSAVRAAATPTAVASWPTAG